jgi:DNA repair exonuclease SbcCD ATPase subunit
MNVIESQPQSLTEQAVDALKAFEPMVDQILSYADFTVAEDGIGRVEEAHKAVKRLRIELDKKRKELNEGALQYQRTVNATAKSLTERISKVESRLEAERETFEEAKRKEKAAKEAEKAAVLNERVARLSGAGVVVTDLAAVGAMDATDFEFFFAKESRIAAQAKAEAERLEALRLEENARQAEELRIRQEELKAEQDRLTAERAAEAAKLRAEREAMESERAEMRRQQEEIAKHQAELRAKAEAEAAEKRRLEKEAEEARKAALVAPELEKLEAVLNAIRDAAGKAVVDCGDPAWCVQLDEQLTGLAMNMRHIVRDSI